jgi:hypothetical protein
MKFTRICVILACIIFIALCFANTTVFVSAGTTGLKLIYSAVLPILFPFFFLSSFIINMSVGNNKQSLIAVILLSYFSGYPNGARLVGGLYNRGEISVPQAQGLCIYTATASPIFVIVSVGTIMLKSTGLGVLIFISMIVGAIINGLMWQRKTARTPPKSIIKDKKLEFSILQNFNSAISSSVTAILNVCGIILIFYIFVAIISLPPVVSGFVEMTTGASQVAILRYTPEFLATIICFIVSFGGFSVAMQNFIWARDYGISPLYYFSYKITHAIISTAILSAILLL